MTTEKKKIKLIAASAGMLFILASAAAWFFFAPQERFDMKDYLFFQSRNPAFDFTFRYPHDWKPLEAQGRTESYDTVQLIGPRDEINQFSPGFSVTVKQSDGKNAEELLENYLKTESRFQAFKSEVKTAAVDRIKVKSATYEHLFRLPLRKLNAKDVPMKGRAFFIVRENKNYRFNFFGTTEQFQQHEPVLKNIIKTFRFTEPKTG